MNNLPIVTIDSQSFFIRTQTAANLPARVLDIENLYRILVGHGASEADLGAFSDLMDADQEGFWAKFDQVRICGKNSLAGFVLNLAGIEVSVPAPEPVAAESSVVTSSIRTHSKVLTRLNLPWKRQPAG